MSRPRFPRPSKTEMELAVTVLLATAGRPPDQSHSDSFVWVWCGGPMGDLRADYWWSESDFPRSRHGCWTLTNSHRRRRLAGPTLADVLAYLKRPEVRAAYRLDEATEAAA